jgi:hypothetical protein
MQAALISLLKWVAATILVPLIQKWVAAYFKSKEKLKKLRKKKQENEVKTENYEKDPSDSNFGNLP